MEGQRTFHYEVSEVTANGTEKIGESLLTTRLTEPVTIEAGQGGSGAMANVSLTITPTRAL